MNALILAAGLGTRLKPITDYIPKALFPINGKPLLQHIIEKLSISTTDGTPPCIVVNTYHHAEQIINFIKITQEAWNASITVSDERPNLLGTGGAIKHALHKFSNSKPILIHNVDIISNIDIRKFYYDNQQHDATLLVSQRKTARYLIFDSNMLLAGWINLKTGEIKSPYPELQTMPLSMFDTDSYATRDKKYYLYAFSGIHIITHSLTDTFTQWQDRFSIIDFYLANCKKYKIHAYTQPDIKITDAGKIEDISSISNLNLC